MTEGLLSTYFSACLFLIKDEFWVLFSQLLAGQVKKQQIQIEHSEPHTETEERRHDE